MKILYTNFHEQCGGGHDTYIFSLAKSLVNFEEIAVAAPETSILLQKMMTVPKIKTFPFNFQFKYFNFFDLYKKVSILRRFLVQEQFDIIHVNGSKDHTLIILASIFLAKKPKIIFTKHNSLPIKLGAKLRYQYFTDHIIAVGASITKTFPPMQTPITVIHNGIDIDFFKPYEQKLIPLLRKKYGIKPDDLVFGSVAGTALYKGWHLLLEAIAQLPPPLIKNVRVIIAGNMPSAKEIEEYVEKAHLENVVLMTGLLNDVREAIAIMDVGFVLSYAVETISFACREMMAMGKAVIVSDYADLPENITNNVNGYITKCKDINSIKSCIEEIITHRQNLSIMGKNARKKAEDSFSLSKFVENTLAVYTEAVAF